MTREIMNEKVLPKGRLNECEGVDFMMIKCQPEIQ